MRVACVCVVLSCAVGCREPVGRSSSTGNASSAPTAEIVIRPPATRAPREPPADAARMRAIQRDADAIRAQCRLAAAGDWSKWQRSTEPYRQSLKSKLAALDSREREGVPSPGPKYLALAGLADFPLFEIAARENLNYLTDPDAFAEFRAQKPVIVASRWFRRWGVDLIFVPAPKMTEVYIENFLNPVPADGVIAPHARQALLEMLEAGVEVIDVYSLFRNRRAPDPRYLFHTADTHWGPRGMQIAAKELADRIERYSFGKAARQAAPIVKETSEPYSGDLGMGFMLLTEEQRRRLTDARTRTWSKITAPDGEPVADDATSPVFVVGNSYVTTFREVLIRELNMRVRTNVVYGSTTEPIHDFLIAPEFLSGVRVVIWITTEEHMTHFKPLPAPFMTALQDAD